jgi:hypothetical protein
MPNFPPSLSAIRSEFQVLCEELGGPVTLSETVDHRTLEWACKVFGFRQAWETFRKWQPDRLAAMRHWPWVALAADQYRFERTAKAKYVDEPKPSEILELVTRIAAKANGLGNDLARLNDLSFRLPDPEAPTRQGHLAWLNEFLVQNLAKGPQSEVDEKDFVSNFLLSDFLKHLGWVEIAAKTAIKRIEPELLRRVQPQADRGLGNLVWRCAKIWESLTSRKASINKVTRRGGEGDERPDFAIFVSNVTTMACGQEPTLNEITTAFHRTRSSAKKKPQ